MRSPDRRPSNPARASAREPRAEAANEFISYLTDQLRRWAPVTARRLFGGHALYRGTTVFAIVSRDTLYLRTDPINRPEFEGAGSTPFRPGSRVSLPYHEVPIEALDDPEALGRWAQSGYAAALRRDAASSAPRGASRVKRRRRAASRKRRED